MNRFKKEQLKKKNAELIADILKGDRTFCSKCKKWHNIEEGLLCAWSFLANEIEIDLFLGTSEKPTVEGLTKHLDDK